MFGRGELKEYDYTDEQLAKFQYAKVTTDKGVIWLKLDVENVPNTVANFATLAMDGFYDGLNFHRVIDDFMAQGGCPEKRGTGGPGWSIRCETGAPNQIHNRGSLSMAHAGKDTGGSQFFICFEPQPHLNGAHTVFGGIDKDDKESFETLDNITQGTIMNKVEIKEKRD